MRTIVVSDYNPLWPKIFEELRASLWPVIKHCARSIEHVGSTAVPGLAAKPIIDLSIVVRAKSDTPLAIARLAGLGYVHRGNLGVEDREAFQRPPDSIQHHLYVCPPTSVALANHVTLRDYLRQHQDAVREYGELKKRLASEFTHDMESYIDGKTTLILGFLRKAGLPEAQLQSIESANRK